MHSEVVSFLNEKVAGCNASTVEVEAGDQSVTVEGAKIVEVCEALKASEWNFNVLQVVSGVDYPEENIIEVNYMLAHFPSEFREIIIKTRLPRENPTIPTLTGIWKAADFQERECFDMLGVTFEGHPDLRRILCPEDWEGFPLRKDYVVQEVYNGMVVNPEHKMNREDHEFCARMKLDVENPKLITGSWKHPVDVPEPTAKEDA